MNECDVTQSLQEFNFNCHRTIFYRVQSSVTSIAIEFDEKDPDEETLPRSLRISKIGGFKRDKAQLTDLLSTPLVNDQ
jgi:hypothetical protein